MKTNNNLATLIVYKNIVKQFVTLALFLKKKKKKKVMIVILTKKMK